MKVVTPEQMNEIDRRCITEIGIPGIILMENAALQIVNETKRCLGIVKGRNIILLAGKGNNGGDAFAAARHLFNMGANIKVFLLANKNALAGDAKTNHDIIAEMDIDIQEVLDDSYMNYLENSILSADLIIDGIFGTGLRGSVKGIASHVIDAVNMSGKKLLAIDIPSGVNGLTGEVKGSCIKADVTVTFGLPKQGLLIHPGCEYTGKLEVCDIGIPKKVLNSIDINVNTIDRDLVEKLIPRRVQNSNKGSYGKAFIISGSRGMTGAGCLAGKTALRSGAGLVYLGVPGNLTSIYDSAVTETITIPLKDNNKGYLSKSCTGEIDEWLNKVTVAAVGPGLSLNEDITDIVSHIISVSKVPLILDADALNAIGSDPGMLKNLKVQAVLTPHPGEMSRLTGITIQDVQNNRIDVAREFSSRWGVITVLKGAKTVVACPDGRVYINITGNSGMATAGTGDVLTGLITGFAAQGAELVDAAVSGVFIHGTAGDRIALEKGEHGLIAGDLAEEIPYVIKELAEAEYHKRLR